MWKKCVLAGVMALVALVCIACAAGETETAPTPVPIAEADSFILPDDIRVDTRGVPQLQVYETETDTIRAMDLEEYLWGVLAGEMKNDWPEEALKAQAILARTFVIKFITEKESQYEGADISTDINEAQAYDASGVNDRIKQAVAATRGQIVCYEGQPIYAWFHAHAGGRTAEAMEGLDYQDDAPYTQSVESKESAQAPQDAADWSARFSEEAVLAACADVGVNAGDHVDSVSAGNRGESGRTETLLINGKSVPANEFRIAIGSSEMKSTLLTGIAYADGTLQLSGKGYGHGVGMSQWGAYQMAEEGKNAEEIIEYYFKNVDIVQMW